MSFYFPNVDPAFVYQRKVDEYIDLVETEVVTNGFITLKEVPLFSNKVVVKKLDGTALQEVTTDTLAANQFRVDYSTGMVYFHSSLEGNKLTFYFKGTGYVSFPASRVYVDSNTNAQNKSIQQLINDLDNNYRNNWKTAVNNYADITTTYPSPALGDTVQTISDNKIYRFDGQSWIFTQQYSASAITDAQNKIGDLSGLQTTAKSSLVSSLNESFNEIAEARGAFDNVKGRLDNVDTKIGSLSNLGTVSKVNLVGAINENKNNLGNLTSLQTIDKSSIVNAVNENIASMQITDSKATKALTTFSTMRDPLSYLNSVEVLCSFTARGNSTTKWLQGFSINEATNEIYAAFQENNGTELTIEIRNLDGTFKESKSFPIESGAYTESLPFFYNGSNDLCFIVRTQNADTYNIFNYSVGILGMPISISGNRAKSDVDGNYFVTCDTTSTSPYTMKTVYIYDWVSVKNGVPILLNSFRVSRYGNLIQKAQGLVVNNGYIFLTQGESNGEPSITVYNTAGELVNAYLYTKDSLANAINNYLPNAIPDVNNFTYENESGCKYKGKLTTAHILNSTVYITIHNSPSGKPLDTKVPIYRIDTDWQSVTLLNGAIVYGTDTTPRVRRIGNEVILSGAIKGFTVMNTEYLEFYSGFAPDRNLQSVQPTSNGYQCNWQIQPNGRAKILTTRNPTLDVGNWYPFHITWFI
jgi:hypothetical protein